MKKVWITLKLACLSLLVATTATADVRCATIFGHDGTINPSYPAGTVVLSQRRAFCPIGSRYAYLATQRTLNNYTLPLQVLKIPKRQLRKSNGKKWPQVEVRYSMSVLDGYFVDMWEGNGLRRGQIRFNIYPISLRDPDAPPVFLTETPASAKSSVQEHN